MKKKGKKYWSKGFYILISVIVVPTLLTILLTAFEDTTNEWMMRIGGNEPAAIKAKRLAGSGELIHSDCARLGMKLEDVLKKCPQPVYRLTEHQTEKPYHFIEKLRIQGEENRIFTYSFTDRILTEMEVSDPAFKQVPFPQVRKAFEDVEHQSLEQTNQYSYKVSSNQITFIYDNTKKLTSIRVKSLHPLPPGQASWTWGTEHHAKPEKEIPFTGISSVMQRLKPMIEAGDPPAYDCGPLGSTYDQIKKHCKDPVTRSKLDVKKKKRQVRYEYKNRRITLSLRHDRLTRIDIREKGEPWPIHPENVRKIFGKPKKQTDTKLFYPVKENTVIFTFTAQKQLHGITVTRTKEMERKMRPDTSLDEKFIY